MVTRTRQVGLLIFALLGLGASATSTWVHYHLVASPETATSFCDVNANVSCTQAYLSPYGSFLGVPVALAGLLFFALVAVLLAAARSASSVRENAVAYVFALSIPAAAFAAYLAWASYAVLGTFCILCGLTYVAVLGLLLVSATSLPFPVTHLPDRARHDARALVTSPAAVGIGMLFVAAAVAAIAAFPHEVVRAEAADAEEQPSSPPLSDADRARIEEWWNMQPVVDVPIPAAGAKVLIVKFNDYQCPACERTHRLYKPVIAKYTSSGAGDVRYVLKHFPLEGECNPPMARMNHFGSCEAAAGVIMARANGTAQKLEDWIFANIGPPALTSVQMREAARDIGGVKDFDAQYSRVLEEVRADAALGASLKVTGTPTFFINGRRLPLEGGIPQASVFDAIIQFELKRPR
ncbi:MAG TPA: vitamin K epoxide reductase family protein [Vicinamibacterales bacterium]|nr:vitamin K epoxide reductase family protein [Vicinamibacterales bacterium]